MKTDDLLRLVHEIADPSEAIIQAAQQIAADTDTAPEIATACRDLETTMRHAFDIAAYLLKETHR